MLLHLRRSPTAMILFLMATIFLAETLVMLLFYLVKEKTGPLSSLLDATLLSVMIAPVMYLVVLRPMEKQQLRIAEQEQWLRAVTNNLPVALITLDRHGDIITFNPSAERMFGYAAADMAGKGMNVLLHSDPDCVGQGDCRNCFCTTGAIPLECEAFGRHKDGRTFPVDILKSNLRVGKRMVAVLVIRDMTMVRAEEERRRNMERMVEQTQRLESLGVLAGGIAHEFNNVLSAIMGNAGVLEAEADKPEARRMLRGIQESCSRGSDLCSQMLAYAGKGRYQVADIDLSDTVANMSRLIEVAAGHEVRVVFALASELPPIHSDPTQMEQVVLNLVSNAVEAVDDGNGEVTIRTGRTNASEPVSCRLFGAGEGLKPGDYVYLEVADTGPGMDEAVQERMFEPFFSTKFSGRGLGMSAVLGIVRAHEGAACVSSRPGGGTTIRVMFPCVQPTVEPELRQSVEA